MAGAALNNKAIGLIFIIFALRTFTATQTKPNYDVISGLSSTLSLYISEDSVTQDFALSKCTEMGGNLVHLFNRAQDDEVRIKLLTTVTPGLMAAVWTSGRYNFTQSRWEWASIQRPLIYENWLASFPVPDDDSCVGIAALHHLSTYGWVTMSCSENSLLPFICAFP